jgi:hypothetical protein
VNEKTRVKGKITKEKGKMKEVEKEFVQTNLVGN